MSKMKKYMAWDKLRQELLPVQQMDFSQWWVSCDPGYAHTSTEYGERNSFKNERTDRHILLEFTGAHDKTNRALHEGDVVWVRHLMVENAPSYRAIIIWDNYRFALSNLGLDRDASRLLPTYTLLANLDPFGLDLEWIGNIYTHPEFYPQQENWPPAFPKRDPVNPPAPASEGVADPSVQQHVTGRHCMNGECPVCFPPANEEVHYPESQLDAHTAFTVSPDKRTHDELIALLQPHAGEHGNSEGATEVLTRLLKELDEYRVHNL